MKIPLRIMAVLLVALAAAVAPAAPRPAQADLGDDVADKVLVAVVKLTIVAEISGEWEIIGGCSGTIISPDGYILTNSHCVNIDVPGLANLDKIWFVSLTEVEDEPPVLSFTAEVAADAPDLDLAVLKIVADLSGSPVDSDNLDLPFLELGDSDTLKTRQPITIFGYPGIGYDTITITTGKITGFLPEGDARRAWIKTDAAISGGNSGGTAVSDDGLLIGVPTETETECRRSVDSNGDGTIDERDYCRAVGNPVNFVRSINLAKPVIEQAMSGLGSNTDPDPNPTPTPSPTPTGNASVSRLIFASGINDEGEPVSVVSSLPKGSRDLVMYFDFANFQSGVEWRPRLFLNNKEVEDQWPLEEWDAESNGSYGRYIIGFVDADLPDGSYKFQIDYNGKSLGSSTIELGGAKKNDPALSNIAFSAGESSGYVLPAGSETVRAQFDAANMKGDTDVKSVWYRADDAGKWAKIVEDTKKWNSGAGGEGTVDLDTGEPLEAGLYRLELSASGKLAATSDFALTGGGNNGAAIDAFGPIVFAAGRDDDFKPIDPATEFPDDTTELFFFFDFLNMRDGLDWAYTWLLDGEAVLDGGGKWDSGEEGTLSSNIYMPNGDPLPAVEYEVRLTLEGEELQRATATIGEGGVADPTPTPEPTEEGVKITGTIVDAVTGRPIPSAVFGVLAENVTWENFGGRDEEILGEVKTDRNGEFAMRVPVQRGLVYSIGVLADGYEPILQDGVEIPTDAPDVLEITVELQPVR